jgi:hypothetical protein
VKAIEDTIGVEELEDIEMEEIEAVGALANEEEGAPGEERGDWMGATQTEDEGGEEGGYEATVDEEIGGTAYEGVEEESDNDQAYAREDEALARGENDRVLQFAQGDAGEEGAEVG